MAAFIGDPAPPPPGGREPGSWYAGPVPECHTTGSLTFVRLTAAHAELDYEALMASRGYLRRWSDSDWPADDFTVEENREELAWHDDEHEARIAFTYSVLDPTRSRVLGCLYVRPLRDMLLTRGVEPPEGSSWPAADAPSARGWVRRDVSEETERRFLAETLKWLTGPDWAFPLLWWAAASCDIRQLALLDELGWTRELRVTGARPGLEWVLRRAAASYFTVTERYEDFVKACRASAGATARSRQLPAEGSHVFTLYRV